MVVLCSLPERSLAERCAEALVEDGLCAGAQVIGPVTSRYRWQGRVERREEWICLAKTGADRVAAVCAALRERHPYELPGILALPVSDGLPEYLAWIESAGWSERRPGGSSGGH